MKMVMRPAAAALARASEPLEPGRAPLATITLHKAGVSGQWHERARTAAAGAAAVEAVCYSHRT